MRIFKLIMRIIISIITFIPGYILLFAMYSLCGVGLLTSLCVGLSGIFAVFTDDKEWKENVREAWEFFFMPFIIPFSFYKEFIINGKMVI